MFLRSGKILGDSSLVTWMHADGVGYNTRKLENQAEFQYYGPKIKKMRNSHGDAMPIVLSVIFDGPTNYYGIRVRLAGCMQMSWAITRNFGNRTEFQYYGSKIPKNKEL